MQTKLLFIIFWVLSLVAIYLASLSAYVMPPEKYHFDKLLHFLTYFTISFFPVYLFLNRSWIIIFLAVFLISFGAEIEIAQNNVPGRMFSFADITANSLGVLTGIMFARYRRKKKA